MNFQNKISVVIPTFNEEENVVEIAKAVETELVENCRKYDYEILFIDNDSKDNTQQLIRQLCEHNNKIKAIFNKKNFGPNNSPYYGLCQATGDCAILMVADFQDPVSMISVFVKKWEEGNQVVAGVKTTSLENPVLRRLRTLYYKTINKYSDTRIIEHFTGFGLYDKKFLRKMAALNDPSPFLRGVVSELAGENVVLIPYEQKKRKAGKSSFNFYAYYDMAMQSFTSYTSIGLRLSSFIGYVVAGFSAAIGLFYLIYKLINWQKFDTGMAPLVIGMFFLGAVQLIFLGFIGEYILAMNKRLMNRPLVFEKERLNFEKKN